jgi:hypothetical protein
VCKLHGKASVYRDDGDQLRISAIESLMSDSIEERFRSNPRLGLVANRSSLIEHNEKNMTYSLSQTEAVANELGLESWRGRFPAGSMFWFRPSALARLASLSTDSFDVEKGLADGTRAHAIERLFCAVCISDGYTVDVV